MRFKARYKPGQQNATEMAYSRLLEEKKRTGQIQNYWFEGIKLKLATKTFYSPDFLVLANDGTLECHEVKGFWMDDARVKIKVAAEQFPFRFVAAQLKKREWVFEEF